MQTCDNLGLAGRRRPGNRKENGRSFGGDELLDALNKKLVHLGIRFFEIFVADGLTSLKALLLLLEAFERLAAQVRQHLGREVDRPMQKVKPSYVEIKVRTNPLLRVVSRDQTHKQHDRQPKNIVIQHNSVV